MRSLVVREALVALRERKPKLVSILPAEQAVEESDIVYHRMTCHSGGSIELYLEPVLPRPHLIIFGHSAVARARCGTTIVTAARSSQRARKAGPEIPHVGAIAVASSHQVTSSGGCHSV